jgi:hypothetical protein
MLDPPYRFERLWVAGQTGNYMPVDMGKLIAEEFIVDLSGIIDPSDNLSD